jgi:hypothetical protein
MASRALAACVVIVLAACGGGDNAPEAGPTPYGGAAIQTAEQFGFIRSVDTSTEPATLEFDEAEWLTGEAAQKAAVEDGQLEPGQPVANDYYIRNTDKATRVLEVGPDTAVTATRCQLCRGGKPGNVADFLASFSRKGQTYNDDYRGAESQYWLTIEDGRVLAIDEQYRP